MEICKTGELIRVLRRGKGLTQKRMAEILHVSEKTISKWERGGGLPDISMLPALSDVLGIDIGRLLCGSLEQNVFNGGNMKRIRFYACPKCGDVITSTGETDVICCSQKLTPLRAKPCDEAHAISLQMMDGEIYISFQHEMTKAHYIRFIACAGYDRYLLVRLYAEQGGELRVPYMPHCTYYIGCSRDGLFTHRT